MSSILALDAAALQSAKDLSASQPQAKFLGNIAQAAAPLLGVASMFATGGATAPLLFASKLAAGAGMLGNAFGGGGGGGGGGQQQGGGGALNGLMGALGPAVATNALARGDWRVAEQLRNDAYNRNNEATRDSLNAFQNMASQYRDPAFTMNNNPYLLNPNQLAQMQAPQVSNVMASQYGGVPGLASSGGFGPPQQQQQGGIEGLLRMLFSMGGGQPQGPAQLGGTQAPMQGQSGGAQPSILGADPSKPSPILGDPGQFQQLAAQFNNQFLPPGAQPPAAPAPPAAPTPGAQQPAPSTQAPMVPQDTPAGSPFRTTLPRFRRAEVEAM